MPLPKLKSAHFGVKLPIMGDITYRPIYMSEEGAIIQALELSKDKNDFNELMKKLINAASSIDDANKLALSEFIYLTLMIRMKSKGSYVEMIKVCDNPDCKKKFEFNVDIEDSIKFINPTKVSLLVEVNEGLSLYIKPITIGDYFKRPEDMNTTDYTIELLSKMVTKAIVDKKSYDVVSPQELKENILSRLNQADFKVLNEKIGDLLNIEVSYEYECPHCHTEYNCTYENPFDFLF